MRTLRRVKGRETYFIMVDVDPRYHEFVRDLHYFPLEEGFGKVFPTNTPGLDGIYTNFQRDAEDMVLQIAGARSVPWDECLKAFLDIVRPHDVTWWLCGSAALGVRGMEIGPRDIDLVVDGGDAKKLGELLQDHLIEPVVRVEDWFCKWFGRAFLHARLEWVGGVDERADHPEVGDFGPIAESRLETVVWRGRQIRLPPLDLQLRVNERRGLDARVEMIERFLKES